MRNILKFIITFRNDAHRDYIEKETASQIMMMPRFRAENLLILSSGFYDDDIKLILKSNLLEAIEIADIIKDFINDKENFVDISIQNKEFHKKKKDFSMTITALSNRIQYLAQMNELEKVAKQAKFYNDNKTELEHTITDLKTELSQYKKSLEESQEDQTLLKKSLQENKEDIEKSQKNQDDIQSAMKNQKIEHITILGIFASLIFSVFSGIESISAVFARIGKAPLNELLIFTGVMVIAMLSIIFMGFNAISKIAGKSISSSHNCAKNNCGDTCKCSVKDKHPTLFFAGGMSILLLIIGFSYYFANSIGSYITDHEWGWTYYFSTSFGIIISIVGITVGAVLLIWLGYFIHNHITKNKAQD